jgi:hypothetical protein
MKEVSTCSSDLQEGSGMILSGDDDDDLECRCGNIGSRLICILGYNGSMWDILINYALILINLSYCILEMKRSGGGGEENDLRRRRRQEIRAMGALAFVVAFQVVLCLAVGCSGVSIIWCAICGWIMSRHKRLTDARSAVGVEPEEEEPARLQLHTKFDKMEKMVVLLDVAVIIYYAVTLPFISTVAHICALVLGAVLFSVSETESNRQIIGGSEHSAPQPNQPLLSSVQEENDGATIGEDNSS